MCIIGRSEHNSVVIRADSSERCVVGSKTVLKRDFNNEAYECIERDLNSVNWSLMYRMSNCQDQANFFYDKVCSAVN